MDRRISRISGERAWYSIITVLPFILTVFLFNYFRSRDNTRSERLWVDMTRGVGSKWSIFFWQLEDSGELDPSNQHHLWLIHAIFLPHINYDLTVWAGTWNLHKMHIKGERTRSPYDMFVFGVIQHGIQPLEEEDEDAEERETDLDVVDEEEADNVDVDAALRSTRVHQRANYMENPFVAPIVPHNLSRDDCEPPEGTLTEEQLNQVATFLEHCPWLNAVDMESRRMLWRVTLRFCTGLFALR